MPAVARRLRAGAMGPDLARAAVALAYTGGDEALGAIEFALHNHPDEAARRFIDRLLSSPAEVRASLAEDVR